MNFQVTQDALAEANTDIAHLERLLTSTTVELLQARKALAQQRTQLDSLATASAASAAASGFHPAALPATFSPPLRPRFSLLPCSAVLSAAAISSCLSAVAPFLLPWVLPSLPQPAASALASALAGLCPPGAATELATLPCRLLSTALAYLPLAAAALLLYSASTCASSPGWRSGGSASASTSASSTPSILTLTVAALLGAAASLGSSRAHPAMAWPQRLYTVRQWWAPGDSVQAVSAAALTVIVARLFSWLNLTGGRATDEEEETVTARLLGRASSPSSSSSFSSSSCCLPMQCSRQCCCCNAYGLFSLTAATALAHLQVALAVATALHLLALHAPPAPAAAAAPLPLSPGLLTPTAWSALLACWWVACSLLQLLGALRALAASRASRLRFLLLLDRCALQADSAARVPDLVLLLAAEERRAAAAARRAGSALIAACLGALGLFPGFPFGGTEAGERAGGRRGCLLAALAQLLPVALPLPAAGHAAAAVSELCAPARLALVAHPEDLLTPAFLAFLAVGAL